MPLAALPNPLNDCNALERGEGFVAHQIAQARRGRDIAAAALSGTGRCRFALPQAAFYLLFAVEGETDTELVARWDSPNGTYGIPVGLGPDHTTLIPAALMIGHHFSVSAL